MAIVYSAFMIFCLYAGIRSLQIAAYGTTIIFAVSAIVWGFCALSAMPEGK